MAARPASLHNTLAVAAALQQIESAMEVFCKCLKHVRHVLVTVHFPDDWRWQKSAAAAGPLCLCYQPLSQHHCCTKDASLMPALHLGDQTQIGSNRLL